MEKRQTYTMYRTDSINLFGYKTYSNLSAAMDNCRKRVYVQTYAKYDNKMGIDTGQFLGKLLWETCVYVKK